MTDRVQVGGLEVAAVLHRFVRDEALPGSGLDEDAFWAGVEALLRDFMPRNRELLQRRDEIQTAIDGYHRENPGRPDAEAYKAFLDSLGYLADDPGDFQIGTTGVDTEVGIQAGPQLVVPLLNARFATNAANARWGSLYDALYGTDVIDTDGGKEKGSSYNPKRGDAVIAQARGYLDDFVPLASGSHADVTSYRVVDAALSADVDGAAVGLADPSAFVGYRGDPDAPEAVLLRHHGLHLEIQIDATEPVGSTDRAGVKDVLVEAAVSTIMDLEDSVAAVDAEDKVLGYGNWLRLMQGTLVEEVTKGDKTFTRAMNPDREYTTPDGGSLTLPGRSLLFIREVGHLMTTDAVLLDGAEVPEGLLDAVMCALGSLADVQGRTERRNSRSGSMYVVKPKMHGPDEVAFANEVFGRVEDLLGLQRNTIKLGIMDEERRTSINLKACVHAARDRVAFINTGFLDRTGDEIHTSMQAGPAVRKAAMRDETWIKAYEDNNVDVGLACGFHGRAQIGKGMWPAPDNMAEMLAQKANHPKAGASTAWVPSPTAATLHALHYHQVDVAARQEELAGRTPASRADLLVLPISDNPNWSDEDIAAELDNNTQGVLGYVVRWIDSGVGCSKVPDITGTPLMEDRATCRISSQHVGNWLLHGVISEEQVEDALRRMAEVVDEQNNGNDGYRPMAPAFDGEAFLAARALLLEAVAQPSGYTEPILHAYRRRLKESTR